MSWLSILKIIAEALTAGFGILGLLSDFRGKDNKITRTGKVALVGIAASFLVSGAITALEYHNSIDEAIKHEQEVQRLLTPIGETTLITLFYKIDEKMATARAMERLKAFLSTKITERVIPDIVVKPEIARVESQKMPPELLEAFGSIVDDRIRIDLYAGIESCEESVGPFGPVGLDPLSSDLSMIGTERGDISAEWIYYAGDKSLTLKRVVKLTTAQEVGQILSVADIHGSTLVLYSAYRPDSLYLKFPHGGNFDPTGEGREMTPRPLDHIPPGTINRYCYVVR